MHDQQNIENPLLISRERVGWPQINFIWTLWRR